MHSSIAVTARPLMTATSRRSARHIRPHEAASRALVTLVLLAFVVSLASIVLRPPMPTPGGWASVRVMPGSSLWELAATHPIDGLDTASTVALIRAENNLTSATLAVGQTILVPSPEYVDTAVALR